MLIKSKNFRLQPLNYFAAMWSLVLIIPSLIFSRYLTGEQFWRAEICAALLLFAVIFWLTTRKEIEDVFLSFHKDEFRFVVAPFLSFIVWSAFSISWAQSPLSATHHTLVWAGYLLFYCLMRQVAKRPKLLRVTLYSLGAILWIPSLLCVVEYVFAVEKDVSISLGYRYSKYSEIAVTALPLFLHIALHSKKRDFLFSALTVVLLWAFVLCSMRRTSLILSVAVTIIVLAMNLHQRVKPSQNKRLLRFALAFVIVTVLFQIPMPFGNRSTTISRALDSSTTQSSNARPFLANIAFEMWKANKIAGVGADNFGLRFNDYRIGYADRNPDDPNLMIGENELPERAHNEYVQILSELGILGAFIFAVFLCGIGYAVLKSWRDNRGIELFTFAAIIGMCAFLTSSLVTSYSFRLMQNGLVFFFLLALAANKLFPTTKNNREKLTSSKLEISPTFINLIAFTMLASCVGLFGLSAARATSQYYVALGQNADSVERAAPLFETAILFDNDNAAAFNAYGGAYYLSGNFADSVPLFQLNIERGSATAVSYFHLSSAEILSNDAESAEKTMAYAVRLYPRSVFARTRYAMLLEINGKPELAQIQYETASALDEKQARGWKNLLTKGARFTSEEAFNRTGETPLMDLQPINGVYAAMTEREILHPEEQSVMEQK